MWSLNVILLCFVLKIFGSLPSEEKTTCPNSRCYCYADEDLECGELFLRKIPHFEFPPNSKNTTFNLLDLSNNRIKRVGPSVFQNLTVKKIKIHHNNKKINISLHRQAFQGLNWCLEKVDFFRNSIPFLPSGLFRNMKALKVVSMTGNRIESMGRGVFRGACNVTKVDLEDNQIRVLNENSFIGLRRLKDLNLNRNKISYIDSNAFYGLESLERLVLRRNEIRDLQPKTFLSLPNLTYLDLSDNNIPAVFPLMFRGLGRLKSLNMNSNPLYIIGRKTFLTLKNLTELRLEKCQLSLFTSGAFSGLGSLTSLYLNQNNIKFLPQHIFKGLKSLSKLQLEYNHLKNLNICSFDSSFWKGGVWLSGNPITCDCDMAWTMILRGVRVYGKCHSPRSAKGQNLQRLTKYQVCRHYGFEGCPSEFHLMMKKAKTSQQKLFKKYGLKIGSNLYFPQSSNDIIMGEDVPLNFKSGTIGGRNLVLRKHKARKFHKRYISLITKTP